MQGLNILKLVNNRTLLGPIKALWRVKNFMIGPGYKCPKLFAQLEGLRKLSVVTFVERTVVV
jgi:hypothetical protein